MLWLAGFLSVGQGNLTAQWVAPHCPSGQAQHSQQSHNHCTWHCAGLDMQGGGGRGETITDAQVSLVWSLGSAALVDAVVDGQFPPRGPPQILFQIARDVVVWEPAVLPSKQR